MTIVPITAKKEAFHFLFPAISTNSEKFEIFSNFVEMEFKKFHCCVLYYLNAELMELLKQLKLEIDAKEVIITNGTVLASPKYYRALVPIWGSPHYRFV